MSSKLLAVTFMFFAVGCNQGHTGLKQKPVDQKFKPVAQAAPQESAPPPMVRAPAPDSSTPNSANPAKPNATASTSNSPFSGTSAAPASAPAPTPTPVAAPAPSPAPATVSAPAAETGRSSIGSLDTRNAPVKPTPEEEEAKKLRAQKQKAREEANKEKPLIDEKKVAAEAANRLNDKARGAENKDTPGRTEEDKGNWKKFVDFVADHGTPDEGKDGIYITLRHVTNPDRLADRILNELSIIGGPDGKGGFAFTRVHVAWENWKVAADGNLDGDQYFFLLSRDGNVAQTWRYHYIKDKTDHMISRPGVDITPEEAQKKWDEIRLDWYKKMETMEFPVKK